MPNPYGQASGPMLVAVEVTRRPSCESEYSIPSASENGYPG